MSESAPPPSIPEPTPPVSQEPVKNIAAEMSSPTHDLPAHESRAASDERIFSVEHQGGVVHAGTAKAAKEMCKFATDVPDDIWQDMLEARDEGLDMIAEQKAQAEAASKKDVKQKAEAETSPHTSVKVQATNETTSVKSGAANAKPETVHAKTGPVLQAEAVVLKPEASVVTREARKSNDEQARKEDEKEKAEKDAKNKDSKKPAVMPAKSEKMAGKPLKNGETGQKQPENGIEIVAAAVAAAAKAEKAKAAEPKPVATEAATEPQEPAGQPVEKVESVTETPQQNVPEDLQLAAAPEAIGLPETSSEAPAELLPESEFPLAGYEMQAPEPLAAEDGLLDLGNPMLADIEAGTLGEMEQPDPILIEQDMAAFEADWNPDQALAAEFADLDDALAAEAPGEESVEQFEAVVPDLEEEELSDEEKMSVLYSAPYEAKLHGKESELPIWAWYAAKAGEKAGAAASAQSSESADKKLGIFGRDPETAAAMDGSEYPRVPTDVTWQPELVPYADVAPDHLMQMAAADGAAFAMAMHRAELSRQAYMAAEPGTSPNSEAIARQTAQAQAIGPGLAVRADFEAAAVTRIPAEAELEIPVSAVAAGISLDRSEQAFLTRDLPVQGQERRLPQLLDWRRQEYQHVASVLEDVTDRIARAPAQETERLNSVLDKVVHDVHDFRRARVGAGPTIDIQRRLVSTCEELFESVGLQYSHQEVQRIARQLLQNRELIAESMPIGDSLLFGELGTHEGLRYMQKTMKRLKKLSFKIHSSLGKSALAWVFDTEAAAMAPA